MLFYEKNPKFWCKKLFIDFFSGKWNEKWGKTIDFRKK